jgi:hypothetical protein
MSKEVDVDPKIKRRQKIIKCEKLVSSISSKLIILSQKFQIKFKFGLGQFQNILLCFHIKIQLNQRLNSLCLILVTK